MAGNPLASLPDLPQRPSPARFSTSETRLTQPGIEVARSRKLNSAPTAAFRLKGWSRQRRIILLRRRVKGALATPSTDEQGQLRLTFQDIDPGEDIWEYQVLATSLVEELGSFGQLYRDHDRSDGDIDQAWRLS